MKNLKNFIAPLLVIGVFAFAAWTNNANDSEDFANVSFYDTEQFTAVELDTSDTETFEWSHYATTPMVASWRIDMNNGSGTTAATCYIEQANVISGTASTDYVPTMQYTFSGSKDTILTQTLWYGGKTRCRCVATAGAQVNTVDAAITVKRPLSGAQ